MTPTETSKTQRLIFFSSLAAWWLSNESYLLKLELFLKNKYFKTNFFFKQGQLGIKTQYQLFSFNFLTWKFLLYFSVHYPAHFNNTLLQKLIKILLKKIFNDLKFLQYILLNPALISSNNQLDIA